MFLPAFRRLADQISHQSNLTGDYLWNLRQTTTCQWLRAFSLGPPLETEFHGMGSSLAWPGLIPLLGISKTAPQAGRGKRNHSL
jgi:hypothetical protein